MLKIILSKLKFVNQHNHWFHTKLCVNINLTMCGFLSNMKSSSHKTWQTLLLFMKPLQIQNLKRKKWGVHGVSCPPSEKVGGHVPRVPHQIAPMVVITFKAFGVRCYEAKLCVTIWGVWLSLLKELSLLHHFDFYAHIRKSSKSFNVF